jgi:hypothetical protein
VVEEGRERTLAPVASEEEEEEMNRPAILSKITVEWSDGRRIEATEGELALCWRYVDHSVERLAELLRTLAELPKENPQAELSIAPGDTNVGIEPKSE